LLYVKRDDLLNVEGVGIGGNKARKFYGLWESEGILAGVDELVSFGGPQSNAFVALAAIASATSTPFTYYTKTLARFLKSNPSGNLLRARALGANIVEVSHEQYSEMFGRQEGWGDECEAPQGIDIPSDGKRRLFIPQGGAARTARIGCSMLANEIVGFYTTSIVGEGEAPNDAIPLAVIVPCGTGTTAYHLHRAVNRMLEEKGIDKKQIEITAVPNAGSLDYLRRQMKGLRRSEEDYDDPSQQEDIPNVLSPKRKLDGSQKSYINFGKPEPFILKMWQELRDEHDLDVDLLYGAPTWHMIMPYLTTEGKDSPFHGKAVMYYHSGGLEGVSSQLQRYKHKAMIASEEVQN